MKHACVLGRGDGESRKETHAVIEQPCCGSAMSTLAADAAAAAAAVAAAAHSSDAIKLLLQTTMMIMMLLLRVAQVMHAIKQAIDPLGIMNPGKLGGDPSTFAVQARD